MKTISKIYPEMSYEVQNFLSELSPFQGYLVELGQVPELEPMFLRLHFKDYEHFKEISQLQSRRELCDCADQEQYIPFASLYFPSPVWQEEIASKTNLSPMDWEILDRAEIFLARSTQKDNEQIYVWKGRFIAIAQNWEHFLLNLRNPRYFDC